MEATGSASTSSRPVAPISDLIQRLELLTVSVDHQRTKHVRTVQGRSARQRTRKVEETWERVGRLGAGSYGVVWLEERVGGKARDDGGDEFSAPASSLRAVKEIRNSDILSNRDLYHEVEAMSKFSQDDVAHLFVQSLGWYKGGVDNSFFMAMEYFEHGDLQNRLGPDPFPEGEARDIVAQVLEALEEMHKHGFVHRDLKPANILIREPGPRWWVKVADFGVSKRLRDQTALRTIVGTMMYLAPELRDMVMESGSEYTCTVDIWSLGEIAHRLLTTRTPFEAGALGRYVFQNTPFPLEALNLVQASPESIEFVTHSMTASGNDRPMAKLLRRYAWFNNMDPEDEGSTDSGGGEDRTPNATLPNWAASENPIPEPSLAWTEYEEDVIGSHVQPNLNIGGIGLNRVNPRLSGNGDASGPQRSQVMAAQGKEPKRRDVSLLRPSPEQEARLSPDQHESAETSKLDETHHRNPDVASDATLPFTTQEEEIPSAASSWKEDQNKPSSSSSSSVSAATQGVATLSDVDSQIEQITQQPSTEVGGLIDRGQIGEAKSSMGHATIPSPTVYSPIPPKPFFKKFTVVDGHLFADGGRLVRWDGKPGTMPSFLIWSHGGGNRYHRTGSPFQIGPYQAMKSMNIAFCRDDMIGIFRSGQVDIELEVGRRKAPQKGFLRSLTTDVGWENLLSGWQYLTSGPGGDHMVLRKEAVVRLLMRRPETRKWIEVGTTPSLYPAAADIDHRDVDHTNARLGAALSPDCRRLGIFGWFLDERTPYEGVWVDKFGRPWPRTVRPPEYIFHVYEHWNDEKVGLKLLHSFNVAPSSTIFNNVAVGLPALTFSPSGKHVAVTSSGTYTVENMRRLYDLGGSLHHTIAIYDISPFTLAELGNIRTSSGLRARLTFKSKKVLSGTEQGTQVRRTGLSHSHMEGVACYWESSITLRWAGNGKHFTCLVTPHYQSNPIWSGSRPRPPFVPRAITYSLDSQGAWRMIQEVDLMGMDPDRCGRELIFGGERCSIENRPLQYARFLCRDVDLDGKAGTCIFEFETDGYEDADLTIDGLDIVARGKCY